MTGPRLVPFQQIVVKVHSRCDLACDHCYIYEHADQSWRTRPKAISDEAISWTALRLAEHAKSHALPSVSVILHGGEPLLAGPARLRRVCEELTAALDNVAALDLRIHTNGIQLSRRHLDLFDEFDVRVGISLDGDRSANDRHRRYADGRTSHPLVLRAVDLLRQERYRHLYLGLLCTIDVANDPVAVYDALAELEPPRIDFLLPHATWDDPPVRPAAAPTAYADWILAVFDRWDARGRPVPVRLFDSVFSTLAGGPSLTESLGLAPSDLVVVETDGTLEQVDSLKSAYEGAAATGFDVLRHSFDEVARHPGVMARQLGLEGVSPTCRQCPVVRSCGGGLYTHRYATGSGFDNTSVYCDDLKALILGIERRTAHAAASPAVTDPEALLILQQDLTRYALAGLNEELDGRGGERWSVAWELASAIDETSLGLDEIYAHPYTRTWLHACLEALRGQRPGAVPLALRLESYVAAAAVRSGLGVSVRVRCPTGTLFLPTLGELRVSDDGGPCEAEVGGTPDRLVVRVPGRGTLRVHPDEPGAGWRPLHRPVLDGWPQLVLDDLDPYRDCFGEPVRPAGDTGSLAAAWAVLRETAPGRAAVLANSLTTLTPLQGTGAAVGRHAYGALGLGLHGPPFELAAALLRGFARAELRAVGEVTDLLAEDGAWLHPAPWQDEPLPASRLLAGAYERVVLAPLDPAAAAHALLALKTLRDAPEPTLSGKRLIAALYAEAAGG
ncbi:radical SAM/SPASM protein FxsB, inactivated metallohydrolase extension form [Streptomyces sp. NPDC048389]|uniref:radical SAM/SPASM protein FxsBH, inactivated beta-hydroxylase extension form n=1 Tax=Streptomyces sp. NPDC048389 TaxID=3154622 RepID=UPI0034517D24